MGKNQKPKSKQYNCPHRLFEDLDALLFFIQKKYPNNEGTGKTPATAASFVVNKVQVRFDDVDHPTIKRNWDDNTLWIIAPHVPAEKLDEARMYYLHYFSRDLVRLQIEAFMDLLYILNGEALKKIKTEYSDSTQDNHNENTTRR